LLGRRAIDRAVAVAIVVEDPAVLPRARRLRLAGRGGLCEFRMADEDIGAVRIDDVEVEVGAALPGEPDDQRAGDRRIVDRDRGRGHGLADPAILVGRGDRELERPERQRVGQPERRVQAREARRVEVGRSGRHDPRGRRRRPARRPPRGASDRAPP